MHAYVLLRHRRTPLGLQRGSVRRWVLERYNMDIDQLDQCGRTTLHHFACGLFRVPHTQIAHGVCHPAHSIHAPRQAAKVTGALGLPRSAYNCSSIIIP